MPNHGYSPDIGGLLAPDIMRNYDADSAILRTTRSSCFRRTCEGRVVYWTHDPYGTVRFISPNEFGQMTVPVTLRRTRNTRHDRYRARLDSTVSLDTIEDDFSIDEKNRDMRVLPELQTGSSALPLLPFKTLSLQSITVNKSGFDAGPRCPIQACAAGEPRNLLLASMCSASCTFTLAYHGRTLYVTPASAH